MKITRNQLRRIINEEITRANRVNEGSGFGPYIYAKGALEDLYGASSQDASDMFHSLPEDVQGELLEIVRAAGPDGHNFDQREIREKFSELQKAGRLPK